MSEFRSLDALFNNIKSELDSAKSANIISLLFSFNGVGKTRLSTKFSDLNNGADSLKVLCYNAFLEDYFHWDNDNTIFKINPNSWIVELIKEQGLEKDIINNFKAVLNTKIEPFFDLENGEIYFNKSTGDENSESNIKISRGEESLFIWIVFYTILEQVIYALNDKEEERTTPMFNELEYIVIDDPVSSLDDTRLITLTINLIEVLKSYKGKNLKVLITTHHALFFNVLYNSFRNNRNLRYNDSRDNDFKRQAKVLSKNDIGFELNNLNDSPFSYHHDIIAKLQQAVNSDSIERYHFNLFRALLEKTSNFLGFSSFDKCIIGKKKSEIKSLLNSYSHNRLSDLEFKNVPQEHKDLFKLAFNEFIKEFKWNIPGDTNNSEHDRISINN